MRYKTRRTRYPTMPDKTPILISCYFNVRLFIKTYIVEKKTSISIVLKKKRKLDKRQGKIQGKRRNA